MRSKTTTAWLLLAPMLLALFAVAALPLLRAIGYSFTDADLFNLQHAHAIGWANYLTREDGSWYGLLVDPDWWHAVGNTFRFALISVSIETVLGLAIALLLHQPRRGRGLLRAAMLVPWAIPTVVSSEIWAWLLDGQNGVVNAVLLHLGIIAHPLAWTADPALVMPAIIMVDVWKSTPFMALLLLAGLQMLPRDCYEAARVDGVPAWKVFLRITLPLLQPALMVALLFRLMDALRVFDIIYVMTGYTPQTESMSVFAQQQLVDFRSVGYGSAASTLVFFIVALVVVVIVYAGRIRLVHER